MAAFTPETKRALIAQDLLAPTLHMLLRRSLAGIEQDDDYLRPDAHLAIFPGDRLQPERMVERAHAMAADALPPLVVLRATGQPPLRLGIDYFDDPSRSEVLLDTPDAIARVMRSVHQQRWTLAVSAADSRDAQQRPLRFRWVVLRGEATVVVSDDGRLATITVPWQGRHPVTPDNGQQTARIDILCVAHNGAQWSAPAYVSFYPPEHETRTYRADGRIERIVYRGADEESAYTDPEVCLAKSWTDTYAYAADGTLTGWDAHPRRNSRAVRRRRPAAGACCRWHADGAPGALLRR